MEKKIPTSVTVLVLSSAGFLIVLYSFFMIRSWQSFLFLIPVLVMCLASFAIGVKSGEQPKKLHLNQMYRFYSKTKNGNLLLSCILETYTTYNDSKGPGGVSIGRRWEKDGIYEGAIVHNGKKEVVEVDSDVKPGDLCLVESQPDRENGKPCIVLYSEKDFHRID